MVVNDNAWCLNQRGVSESIASKLAPTNVKLRAPEPCPFGQQFADAGSISLNFQKTPRVNPVSPPGTAFHNTLIHDARGALAQGWMFM
jgi:hypothetical protein